MNNKISKGRKWLCVVALLGCSVPLLSRALSEWNYKTSDSISKAGFDTERILSSYEKTNDPQEIRSWLIDGPTEAPGTQAGMVFARWAVQHEKAFVSIVEGLPPKHQSRFAELFSYSLSDADLTNQFQEKFRGQKSKVVDSIMQRLPEKG